MGDKSSIEWTDATWPVVQGCDPVSQGCVNCYAVPLLWRMGHHPNPQISAPVYGLVERYTPRGGDSFLRFTGEIALREDRLTWPLKWKKPRMIFVPSHGDIFHRDVPDEFLDKIFANIALAHWHTFQVLTKRDKRMRAYMADPLRRNAIELAAEKIRPGTGFMAPKHTFAWPLPNVWLGVSAEDQANADERIPHLLATPAAIRFLSAEPLLGSLDIRNYVIGHEESGVDMSRPVGSRVGCCVAWTPPLDWVIVGGESGKNARRMHERWARDIRDQCAGSDAAFFFKQWGSHDPETFDRVGKKAAGRLLDGKEHNGFPSPVSVRDSTDDASPVTNAGVVP